MWLWPELKAKLPRVPAATSVKVARVFWRVVRLVISALRAVYSVKFADAPVDSGTLDPYDIAI
jgi:hypothetical protein